MRPFLPGAAIALMLASCSAPPMNPGGRSPIPTASKAPAVTIVTSAPPSPPPSRRGAPPSLEPTAPSPSPSILDGTALIGGKPAYIPNAFERCTFDRPRDAEINYHYFHLLYVVPAGAQDRHFDIDGTITATVDAIRRWMVAQGSDRSFHFDQYEGFLDITFLALKESEAELLAAPDRFALIRDELQQAGFNHTRKNYVALIETSAKNGEVVLGASSGVQVYMRSLEIPSRSFGAVKPKTLEHAMVHGMLHALGFIPPNAPHADGRGHLSLANDVMASPDKADPNEEAVLDPLHVDYFRHGRTDLPELTNSSFMDVTPLAPVDPPSSSPIY